MEEYKEQLLKQFVLLEISLKISSEEVEKNHRFTQGLKHIRF